MTSLLVVKVCVCVSEEAEKRKDHPTRWGAWEFYIKRDTKDTVPINPRDDEGQCRYT